MKISVVYCYGKTYRVIVEAACFEADTPEESAGPESVLRLSVELELTGVFTEVGENI